jgi:hypothetical protein
MAKKGRALSLRRLCGYKKKKSLFGPVKLWQPTEPKLFQSFPQGFGTATQKE